MSRYYRLLLLGGGTYCRVGAMVPGPLGKHFEN